MKAKITMEVSQEQLLEIGNLIMVEPDCGWENGLVELTGDYATYHYEVNVNDEVITLISLEEQT